MARVATLEAEITAETGGFERGLSNVEKAIAGTRTTIGGLDKDITVMGRNIGSANDALAGMGIRVPTSVMAGFGQAVGFVGQQLKAAVDETVDYAKEVRDLGRSIGATAEESSKLIQAADDMQVSVASLEAGLNAAIRKGVEPTIEGLGKLADQYNAIQDPIARTKFLMDNFGRSGADLAPLMEKGAAGIKALGDSAELAGLVMSQEGVDSAREYELAIDQAEDSIMALKLALAKDLVPALTGVANTFNEVITVQNRYDRAVQNGILTADEMRKIQAADLIGLRQVGIEVLEAAEAREKLTAAMKAGRDEFYSQIPATNDMAEAEDQAAKSANYWTREMWKAVDGAKAIAKATTEAASGFDRFSDAMTDAALSGTMRDAQADYLEVIEDTTPAMADLVAEIAKYQAQQGTSVTVTGKATTSAAEFQLASLKAAAAQQELAEASGLTDLEMAQLTVNAEHASANVTKLGEGMGLSATYTADYTAKLKELNGDLDGLKAAQAEAEAALRKTTAEFVLQQAASSLTGQALLEFAHKTGLMDDASYNLAGRVQFLTDVWDKNKNGVIELGAEMNGLSAALALETENTVKSTTASAASIPVYAETSAKLIAVKDASEEASQSILAMPASVKPIDTVQAGYNLLYLVDSANSATTAINNIPTNVNVNTHYTSSGSTDPLGHGPGGQYATGGDFIVPPGYPHDSFQMNVQSGEHVTVVPAGGVDSRRGGAGTTYNFHFNNSVPVTVPTALQTARATAGAW